MDKLDLVGMPLDELWSLHEQITKVLSTRIIAQKRELEHRLLQLNRSGHASEAADPALKAEYGKSRSRRKYPLVLPKFKSPSEPGETWSARGKQPRWLFAALKAGSK